MRYKKLLIFGIILCLMVGNFTVTGQSDVNPQGFHLQILPGQSFSTNFSPEEGQYVDVVISHYVEVLNVSILVGGIVLQEQPFTEVVGEYFRTSFSFEATSSSTHQLIIYNNEAETLYFAYFTTLADPPLPDNLLLLIVILSLVAIPLLIELFFRIRRYLDFSQFKTDKPRVQAFALFLIYPVIGVAFGILLLTTLNDLIFIILTVPLVLYYLLKGVLSMGFYHGPNFRESITLIVKIYIVAGLVTCVYLIATCSDWGCLAAFIITIYWLLGIAIVPLVLLLLAWPGQYLRGQVDGGQIPLLVKFFELDHYRPIPTPFQFVQSKFSSKSSEEHDLI